MQEKKKTKFKVKYKGNKYSVNLRDKVRIERIKFVLCLKRIKRRCFILVPKNIGLYFILTLCWAIFAVFLYFIGNKYKAPEIYSLKDIMWEIKSSYFTSVILALFIAGYSQNSGHKKKMELQHDFYVNVMEGFDSLFEQFVGDELCYYMPFYNDLCLGSTLSFIGEKSLMGKKFSYKQYKRNLKDILKWLEKVEEERKNNNFIGMHKQELGWNIEEAHKRIVKQLRCKMNYEEVIKNVEDIAYDLFHVIEDIRRPWRWDIDNNIIILNILNVYEANNIATDFYYGMHLNGHIFQ